LTAATAAVNPCRVPRAALVCVLLLVAASAEAATTCQFESVGATERLLGDCTTDSTILIADGTTLDGGGFTITAIDPAGRHFTGAVVMNAGADASILNTRITTAALVDVCDGGPSRLRGIFFDGASGVIRGNAVVDLNQGLSRCQEGNAIEVRSLAGDGTATTVEIDRNVIERYQKTGIVVTGSVDAWVHDNQVAASANQERLPANGIQVGYGAWALIERNRVAGNSWLGFPATTDAATAVLIFHAAPGTTVSANVIGGNADIGIYVASDEVTVLENEVVEEGEDFGGYDIGIGDYGVGNRISGNTVRGYQIPYDSLAGSAAKTVARK
jgi:hypothetical protein